MIARAKELFEGIARRYDLLFEWDHTSTVPVTIAAIIPRQWGLDFRLWLYLQNKDEIGIRSDLFSASWLPLDDPEKEAAFLTVANGLISGEVRLLCSDGPNFAKPHKVILQRQAAGQWETIYVYRRIHLLVWPTTTKVVANGRSPLPADNGTDSFVEPDFAAF